MEEPRQPRRGGRPGAKPGAGKSTGGKPRGRKPEAGKPRPGKPDRAGGRAPADRQGRTADRPFRPHTRAPAKPTLPEDVPRLRRDVYRDLRAAAAPKQLDDVARAYDAAGEALAEDNTSRAIELLEWAKSAAARSAAIREALGVAHYIAGNYNPAHSELLAYRRLSGREDQNHLLADCARALGHHDKIAEYVAAMEKTDVPADRYVEALLVQAGARADRDDLHGALGILERAGLDPDRVEPHHLRLWYMAGDLWERLGEPDEAAGYFEAIISVDEEFLDAAERYRALGGDPRT